MTEMSGQCCITVLLGIFFPFGIQYSHEKEFNLLLNENGTLWENSTVPECESGQKINLLSYQFSQGTSSTKCTEELSSLEKLDLYRRCSMQDKCTNLTFPRRLQCSLAIKFECIDPKTTINLCSNTVFSFNNTLHLMYGRGKNAQMECECYLEDGPFRLTLNDVRLTLKNSTVCSTIRFQSGSDVHKCSSQDEDFGAIFRKKYEIAPAFFTSLNFNSTTEVPDMVWLSITTKATTQLTCNSDQVKSETVTTTVNISSSNSYLENQTEQHEEAQQQEGQLHPTKMLTIIIIVAVVVSLCLLLSAVVCVVIGCHLYRNNKRRKRDQEFKRGQSTGHDLKLNVTGSKMGENNEANERSLASPSIEDDYDTTIIKADVHEFDSTYDHLSRLRS